MKKKVFPAPKTRFSRLFLPLMVGWLALSLAACGSSGGQALATSAPSTPALFVSPSPGPSPTPANCLVGIWEAKDKPAREAYLRASVPVGAFQPSELKFIGTVGSVGLRFYNEGIFAVEADQFMGRFDVPKGDQIDLLDIRMNGYASGNYQLDGDQLTITEMKRSDMTYQATIGQETMMSETHANKFLPLFVEPYNVGTVDCSAKTLSVKIPNFPNLPGSLEFTRLR